MVSQIINNKMIVPERAICKVRLPVYEKSCDEPELKRQWADSIRELFLTGQEPLDRNYVRNFDIVLSMDGSAENYLQNQSAFSISSMLYPPRYQLPEAISGRLDTNEERIVRAERFALGSIFYEITSGHQLFHDIEDGVDNESVIQELIALGNFPEDLWDLPTTPTILECLCPEFRQEMLSFRKKCIGNYIKKHPYRFGFQVLGGVATVASVVAVPVLGAVGFSAAGPVAGSAAAAWQSGIGLIEAGSVFAWCQSAAMGGAAVGGIIGAGVGGAGVLAGATSLSALDGADFDKSELKERFLEAWNKYMSGE